MRGCVQSERSRSEGVAEEEEVFMDVWVEKILEAEYLADDSERRRLTEVVC
jgi:hypothetical protein